MISYKGQFVKLLLSHQINRKWDYEQRKINKRRGGGSHSVLQCKWCSVSKALTLGCTDFPSEQKYFSCSSTWK